MVYVTARDDLVATAAYAPVPAAAGAARRFVRDTFRAWDLTGQVGGQMIDDAVLLTSELVTNAVVHAGTPVLVTCRLLDGAAVEIAVLDRRTDPLPTDPPHPATSAADAAGAAESVSGRGLALPFELASAWGVTYARAAKAVWFRMALPDPEPGYLGSRA